MTDNELRVIAVKYHGAILPTEHRDERPICDAAALNFLTIAVLATDKWRIDRVTGGEQHGRK